MGVITSYSIHYTKLYDKTFLEVCGEAKDHPLVKDVLNTFPDAKITKGACKVTKINEDRAKQLYGAVKGGAIRFAPANDVLFIAEGIESALSVRITSYNVCYTKLLRSRSA